RTRARQAAVASRASRLPARAAWQTDQPVRTPLEPQAPADAAVLESAADSTRPREAASALRTPPSPTTPPQPPGTMVGQLARACEWDGSGACPWRRLVDERRAKPTHGLDTLDQPKLTPNQEEISRGNGQRGRVSPQFSVPRLHGQPGSSDPLCDAEEADR